MKAIEKNMEALAAKQHEIWAHWMKYLFSKCKDERRLKSERMQTYYSTGNLIIPKDLVERWQRQVETPYAELSEKEKESDREQVRKFIGLVQ